jgi:DNA primase
MLEELSRRTGISADNLRDYVATHVSPQQRAAVAAEKTPIASSAPENYAPPNTIDDGHYAEFDGSIETDQYADLAPVRASKIRLSPVKFITALLLNHPALAESADDLSFLEKSADQDIQLFLRVLDVAKKNPHYKPSHIFAYWLGTHGNQAETKLLQSLAASELYHPPVGTGRDDNQEFSDALAHIISSAFDTLPPAEKAMHLLQREKLNEREIKQLHKLRLQLPNDEQSKELKNKIKQRLVI